MGKPAGRQRYPDWVRFVEIGGGGTLGVLRLGSFRVFGVGRRLKLGSFRIIGSWGIDLGRLGYPAGETGGLNIGVAGLRPAFILGIVLQKQGVVGRWVC